MRLVPCFRRISRLQVVSRGRKTGLGNNCKLLPQVQVKNICGGHRQLHLQSRGFGVHPQRSVNNIGSSRCLFNDTHTKDHDKDTDTIHTSSLSTQSLEERTNELIQYLQRPAAEEEKNNDNNDDDDDDAKSMNFTLAHFNEAMEAWSKWCNPSAAKRAEDLLIALEQNYDRQLIEPEYSYSSVLFPNAYSYNHVCHAYAQSKGGSKSAQSAQHVLERMLDRCRMYTDTLNTSTSNALGDLKDIYEHTPTQPPSPPPEPLISTFNTVINAWSKSNDIQAGMKSELIFRMMELWNYECHQCMNDQELRLKSGSGSKSGSRKRSPVSVSIYKGVVPNAISLASVLDAWASTASKQEGDESYERILAIFHHAIDQLKFNHTLQQKQQQHDGIDENEDESTSTPTSTSSHPSTIPLNTIALNAILNGLANSKKGIQAAKKAHEVFTIMQDLHESGVLQGALQSGEMNVQVNVDTDGMEMNTQPDTTTWSILLKCWADAVEGPDGRVHEIAAEQCEKILHHMEELYVAGDDIKPNVVTYTSCITAWSKCKSERGALQALAILERMEDMQVSIGGDDLVQPNHIHYNACLSALCMVGTEGALEKAKGLLHKMQNSNLADTSSYNTMIKAYLEHYPLDARAYIEDLSKKMTDNDIPFDRITYNTIIDGFNIGDGGCDDMALKGIIALLDTMIHQCKSNPIITPDALTFTKVLNAIARSQVAEKADPARKVFSQMITMHGNRMDDKMKPDVRVFSAFISACANQGGLHNDDRKRFALKLALGSYEQLCKSPEYGKPNAFVYGGLLKACGRLSGDPTQKGRLIQHVFQKCKDDGQVSKGVMKIFLRSCPHHLKEKFLDGHDDRRVPSEWCRNVPINSRPNLSKP